MPGYRARIDVMLKPLVNDPQGLAVADGLRNLGYDAVRAVRVGKRLEVTLEAPDAAAAERDVREMCQRLIANPVIEDFTFELTEAATTDI
jgi:phosphoribosylformylglycinamidine synthase PurS subunit